jgi:hypothetical protein
VKTLIQDVKARLLQTRRKREKEDEYEEKEENKSKRMSE